MICKRVTIRNRRGRVQYVGTTNNPRRRRNQHRKAGKRGRLKVESRHRSRRAARQWERTRLASHRRGNRGRNPRYNKDTLRLTPWVTQVRRLLESGNHMALHPRPREVSSVFIDEVQELTKADSRNACPYLAKAAECGLLLLGLTPSCSMWIVARECYSPGMTRRVESELRLFAEPAPEKVRAGRVTVDLVDAKSILTPASGFMAEWDYTLNPYSGCGYGCSYCYAAFFSRDQTRRDTWGAWVEAKKNAVHLIRRFCRRKSLKGRSIYMSTVTDPYQPVERHLGLTRSILEELLPHQPRLTIQTRGTLVTASMGGEPCPHCPPPLTGNCSLQRRGSSTDTGSCCPQFG
jgi:hypothetical protein